MVSRVGGMLSPIFLSLHEQVTWLPGCIFGTLAILAGLATLKMPETRGKSLPMTFDDADKLYK